MSLIGVLTAQCALLFLLWLSLSGIHDTLKEIKENTEQLLQIETNTSEIASNTEGLAPVDRY